MKMRAIKLIEWKLSSSPFLRGIEGDLLLRFTGQIEVGIKALTKVES